MVERALLRLARAIDAGPGKFIVACLLSAVAAAVAVSRMPVNTDLLDVFPEGNPAIEGFRDFVRDFGMLDGLVLVVTTRERSPDGLIAVVEVLGEELASSPLIASVDYNLMRSSGRLVAENFPAYLDGRGVALLSERLTAAGIRTQIRRNRQAILSPFASPLEAEWIARDPLNLREIVGGSLLEGAPPRGLDLSTGYYMASDHTFALIMARPDGSARDMGFVGRLYREVARIAAQASAEAGGDETIRVGLAGGYARAAEASAAIWKDMVFSFAVSLVLVIFLIHAAFRPSAVVLGVFVLALFSALAWTLLLAYALYGALNIVTSIVAAVLIGLYVDYLIHTYHRFEEELRGGAAPAQALERTLSTTGKALLSSATTSSVAFFSVVVTRFKGLHELGVVAGFGVLFCLLSSFLLLGPLLSWLAKVAPSRLAAGRPGGIRTDWAARLVERRGGAVVGVFSALVLVAVAGAAGSRFDAGVDSIGLRDSPSRRVERTVEEKVGRRGEPLFLVARAESQARLAHDFDALVVRGERWRKEGIVGTFSSPAMLVPPPASQASARRSLDDAGLPGRYSAEGLVRAIRGEMERQGMVPDESLADYAAGIADALRRDRLVGFEDLARSGDPRSSYYYNAARTAIAAHLTSPGPSWDKAGLSALKDDVRRLGPDFALVGPSLIFEEIRSAILWESGIAALIAFAANCLIVWLHFRRFRNVALVMLPVTAGTVFTVGAMGIFGIPFNFFNVAGIALIFGFGVDYGIYLMQAHMDVAGSTGAEALRRTGGNVVLCSVTTVVSCGSLVTSHYRGLASVGAVLCLGAAFCLLASVLLLPAMLRYAQVAEERR